MSRRDYEEREELAATEPVLPQGLAIYSIDTFTSDPNQAPSSTSSESATAPKRSNSNLSQSLSGLALNDIPEEGDSYPLTQRVKASVKYPGNKKLKRSESELKLSAAGHICTVGISVTDRAAANAALVSYQAQENLVAISSTEDSVYTTESVSHSVVGSAPSMPGDNSDIDMSAVTNMFHVTQHCTQAGLKDPDFYLMMDRMRSEKGGSFKEARDRQDFAFLDDVFKACVVVNADGRVAIEDGKPKFKTGVTDYPSFLKRKIVLHYYAFTVDWRTACEFDKLWAFQDVGLPMAPSQSFTASAPLAGGRGARSNPRKRKGNKRLRHKAKFHPKKGGPKGKGPGSSA